MNKVVVGVLAVGIIVLIGAYLYTTQSLPKEDSHEGHAHDEQAVDYAQIADLGMYPYQCDNGSTFILSPLEGLEYVQVSGDAQGMVTGTATLTHVEATAYRGTTPDGQEVSLIGAGETINLTVGENRAVCSPTPNPDMAPWNWGDA